MSADWNARHGLDSVRSDLAQLRRENQILKKYLSLVLSPVQRAEMETEASEKEKAAIETEMEWEAGY